MDGFKEKISEQIIKDEIKKLKEAVKRLIDLHD